MDIVLVAAVAANRVIGSDGDMPWHYPEDLKRFKRTTTGHPVIMGRKTFESIERRLDGPLPDRTNIVLTSDPSKLAEYERVFPATSIEEALEEARVAIAGDDPDDGVVYVIGGGRVYEQFLPQADRLLLTEIHAEHDGDTRFPAVDEDVWQAAEREQRGEFDFVRYERR